MLLFTFSRQSKVLFFLSVICAAQTVQGHRHEQSYDDHPEEHYEGKPILKRFLRRTHMPIIYKSRRPLLMDSEPSPHLSHYHQPMMNTEWRRWASEMSSPEMYNTGSPPAYEPNYRPLVKNPPPSVSRMYFHQYSHPHHHHHMPPPPNHLDQEDLNNEEPIEIGAGPPPPSMSPSVADLYRDLSSKGGHKYNRPSMHPIMLDYKDLTPYQPEEQYQFQQKEVEEDFAPPHSLYPNFDDNQSLYGFGDFYKKK